MARSLPIEFANQAAIVDDKTESGVMRTRPTRGDYVLMPFKDNTDIYATGSVTASIIGTATYNPTGTGTAMRVILTAGGGQAQVNMRIKGRVFGLAVLKSNSPSVPIGCMIDGVAYPINTDWSANQRLGVGDGGSTDSLMQYILIADDLSNDDHFVELLFPAYTSGASRSYRIYGYVVDRSAGYIPPERGCIFAIPEAVPVISSGSWPTSVAGAAASKGSGSDKFYGLIGYNIINDTASAINVRCMSASASAAATVLLKSIAAGDTYEWRFPKTMYSIDSSLYWVASATGIYVAGIQAL